MESYQLARKNMVTNQVMPVKVHDERILQALSDVPKHHFLEGQWQSVAYTDAKLPLGEGRFMLKPEELALMLQALELTGDERVLDIACGTGYSTTLLSKLASQVVGIEPNSHLATKAVNALMHLHIDNAVIKTAELLNGYPKNAPFEAIFVNGCLRSEPKLLLAQLATYGRLVCSILLPNGMKKAYVYQNLGDSFGHKELFDSTAEIL